VAQANGRHTSAPSTFFWALATEGGGAGSQILEDLGMRQPVLDAVRPAIAGFGPSDRGTENENDEAVVALDETPDHALRLG
jgi:hypothetical protein